MADRFAELRARLDVQEGARRELSHARDAETRDVWSGVSWDQEYRITECIELIKHDYDETREKYNAAFEALKESLSENESLEAQLKESRESYARVYHQNETLHSANTDLSNALHQLKNELADLRKQECFWCGNEKYSTIAERER